MPDEDDRHVLAASLAAEVVVEFEPQTLAVHQTAVDSRKGATDESTVTALRRAGAPTTADLIARLLEAE